MNKEQIDFVVRIADRCRIAIEVYDNDIALNGRAYTYEEFVGEFCDPKEDAEVGMLAIINNVPKVLVPCKEHNAWVCINGMKHHGLQYTVSASLDYTIDKLYGLTNLNSGYCSPYDRVKLYDSSWKKVELTIEQIAEKFGVKPEQVIIKK